MKKVVIIGGGFTGTQCAMDLEKSFDVTLIDSKPYFEFTPGILRTILEPEHEKKIQRLHKNYLKKAKIIIDEVVEVSKKNVSLKKEKEKVSFDYLVIASGSSYSAPIKEEDLIPATRAKELAMYHGRLEKANKVLIIGGGLVGVELAAEICTHYKNKDVMIAHSKDTLIERNHPKARKYVENFFKKHNVKLLFGERIKGAEGKVKKKYVSEKGTRIETDMAFICIGIKANYEFMEKNFSSALNERHQIVVDDNLKVNGCKNIFAGGDITFIKEEKTAQTAEKHSNTIVANINRLESGEELRKYKSKRKAMLISLGKRDCVLDNGKFVLGGFIPAFLKGFVEWKTMIKYR